MLAFTDLWTKHVIPIAVVIGFWKEFTRVLWRSELRPCVLLLLCFLCDALSRGRLLPRSLASTQAWSRLAGRTATYATSGEGYRPSFISSGGCCWRRLCFFFSAPTQPLSSVVDGVLLLALLPLRSSNSWAYVHLSPCGSLSVSLPLSGAQVCGVRSRQCGHGCGPVAVQGHGETRGPRRRGCWYGNVDKYSVSPILYVSRNGSQGC